MIRKTAGKPRPSSVPVPFEQGRGGRPSFAKATDGERGGGGIPPRPSKNRGRSRRLLVQSRTPQKSFLFLLEEKNRARAKSEMRTKLFCGGASVSERRRGGAIGFF